MVSFDNLFHMFPFDHETYLLESIVMVFNFQSFPGLDNIFLSDSTLTGPFKLASCTFPGSCTPNTQQGHSLGEKDSTRLPLPSVLSTLRPTTTTTTFCTGSVGLHKQGRPKQSREEKDAVGVSQQLLNMVLSSAV